MMLYRTDDYQHMKYTLEKAAEKRKLSIPFSCLAYFLIKIKSVAKEKMVRC